MVENSMLKTNESRKSSGSNYYPNLTKKRLSSLNHHNSKNEAINFEEMLMESPKSKKMKISMIYKMDLADANTLRQRVSTLIARSNSYGVKERVRVGIVPAPRDGHSANLYNNNMIIFGGDRNKFPFNDLHIFTL
jgi:hypothetical protein